MANTQKSSNKIKLINTDQTYQFGNNNVTNSKRLATKNNYQNGDILGKRLRSSNIGCDLV